MPNVTPKSLGGLAQGQKYIKPRVGVEPTSIWSHVLETFAQPREAKLGIGINIDHSLRIPTSTRSAVRGGSQTRRSKRTSFMSAAQSGLQMFAFICGDGDSTLIKEKTTT